MSNIIKAYRIGYQHMGEGLPPMTDAEIEKLFKILDKPVSGGMNAHIDNWSFTADETLREVDNNPIRIIYSDMPTEDDKVWAHIGSFESHTDKQDLQAAFALVAMAFNRNNGSLSESNHARLAEERKRGVPLLLKALSQPPKSAMTRSELISLLDNARLDYASEHGIGAFEANSEDVYITALHSAGVLNMRSE